MAIIYCLRDDGLCGWCDVKPAQRRTDAIGTTYLACAECFFTNATRDASRVVMNLEAKVPKTVYQSGCNYWINQGSNEYEAIGTATSMHDCVDCREAHHCKLKKDSDVWPYDEEWAKFSNAEAARMHRLRRDQQIAERRGEDN